jgi:hypothetical protein
MNWIPSITTENVSLKTKRMVYFSPRNIELVCDEVGSKPTLAVEKYCKWYCLYLLYAGTITPIQYPTQEDLEGFDTSESPYVDHVPNPKFVVELARRNNWDIDERSLELMVGRWMMEVKNYLER